MLGRSEFLNAAASLRELIDKQGNTVLEEAFAVMYDNGEMDRYFRKSLKIYKQRRDLFCEILRTDYNKKINFTVPEGGLAVLANFNKKIDLIKLSQEALKKGLNIDDGIFYKYESFSDNGLRLGFASLDENEMIKALGILKQLLH